jgi:hypothetical protein
VNGGDNMGLLNDFFDIFNPELKELSSTTKERGDQIIRSANRELKELNEELSQMYAATNTTLQQFERFKEKLYQDTVISWKKQLNIQSSGSFHQPLKLNNEFRFSHLSQKEYEPTPFTFFFESSERGTFAQEYVDEARDFRLSVKKERERVRLIGEMLHRVALHIDLIKSSCNMLREWCEYVGPPVLSFSWNEYTTESYVSKQKSMMLLLQHLESILKVPVLDQNGNPSRESKMLLETLNKYKYGSF